MDLLIIRKQDDCGFSINEYQWQKAYNSVANKVNNLTGDEVDIHRQGSKLFRPSLLPSSDKPRAMSRGQVMMERMLLSFLCLVPDELTNPERVT